MDPALQLLARQRLLLALRAASQYGLSTDLLQHGLSLAGISNDRAQVERELFYLEGKHLAAHHRDEMQAAVVRWTITAQGIDHLDKEGL